MVRKLMIATQMSWCNGIANRVYVSRTDNKSVEALNIVTGDISEQCNMCSKRRTKKVEGETIATQTYMDVDIS